MPPPNSSYPVRSRRYPGPRMVIQTSPNSFKLQQRRKEIERQVMELDQQERVLKLDAASAQERHKAKAPQEPESVGPALAGDRPTAISAPRPEYPYEARRNKITGSGVVLITIDPKSGDVTSAEMAQSTGSPILDNAATSAFRRWRFKPGHYQRFLRLPITYTMSGATY
jgi:TonB family protein